MKRLVLLLVLFLVLGCTAKKPNVGLEVSFVTRGCSGINNTTSEVTLAPDGLNVVSSIISNSSCYKLGNAEISRKDLNITVYFTFNKEAGECLPCLGVHSLVYKITGEGLNRTGVNVTVLAYFDNKEFRHSFIS